MALQAAVDEAARERAAAGIPSVKSTRRRRGTGAARHRSQVERRRRSRRVQNIALCERLGIKYSDGPVSPGRPRRPRKPPPSSAPAEEAAPGEHPRLLREWARTNANFLSRHGWRRLAKSRRGRSEISESVKDVPHDAAAYLDYLRRCGAPVALSGQPPTPAEL